MNTLVLGLAVLGPAAFGCDSSRGARLPAPQGSGPGERPAAVSYKELVTSTQAGSAVEARRELACAVGFSAANARAKQAKASVPPLTTKTTEESFESKLKKRNAREAVLAAMTRDELVRTATRDEIADTITRRVMDATDGVDLSRLTMPERDIYVFSIFTGEVYNGGFHQFFFNSSGGEALAVREAITRIGPLELLPLYDCALTAFPDAKPSRDRETRNEQLSRWGEAQFEIFDALDTSFYGLDSISDASAAYVGAHVAEFPSAVSPSPAAP